MSNTWLHSIRQQLRPRAMVLMYHRIADVAIDPWQLAVAPHHFEQQVQWLTENYQVLSVSELLHCRHQNKIPANSVCLTFDDGYTDNYLFAKPILEQYRCPATFFIPSHFTGSSQLFWWDALQEIILEAPQLPQLFEIPMPDEVLEFDLGDEQTLHKAILAKHQAWVWPQPPPTRRASLYLKIWERLKPLSYFDIEAAMQAVKQWAGHTPKATEAQHPMTATQLHQLSQNPLFSLGLHTATHPALAYHPEEAQYHDIAENKKALQQFHPVNAIAYPYGSSNNTTTVVLRKQRIEGGFTTEAGCVTRHTNPICMGRFLVANWNKTDFAKHLRQWQKG